MSRRQLVGRPLPSRGAGPWWSWIGILVLGGSSVGCDEGDPIPPPRATCEPATVSGGTWRPIPELDFGIVPTGLTHAWSGEELLVFGEATEEGEDGHPIVGAAYSPAEESWRPIVAGPLGGPFGDGSKEDSASDDSKGNGALEGARFAGSVWTGSEWIVWGGQSSEEPEEGKAYRVFDGGARFDPETDVWTPMAASPFGGRFGFSALWTGTEMVVWGGFDEEGALTDDDVFGFAYDPETDTWRELNASGNPRAHVAPVWTGTHMVIWAAVADVTYGAKYDPSRDTWSEVSSAGAPVPSGAALWTGEEVLAWAFAAETWARYRAGAYNPITDRWRTLSTEGAPPSTREVWTGARVLTWGDFGDCGLVGSYDPEGDTWERLGGSGAPAPRGEPALIWTGDALLVFGGRGGADGVTPFTDGGLFSLPTP